MQCKYSTKLRSDKSLQSHTLTLVVALLLLGTVLTVRSKLFSQKRSSRLQTPLTATDKSFLEEASKRLGFTL